MTTSTEIMILIFLGVLCVLQLISIVLYLINNRKLDLLRTRFDSLENTLIHLSRGSLAELKNSIISVLVELQEIRGSALSEFKEILSNFKKATNKNDR